MHKINENRVPVSKFIGSNRESHQWIELDQFVFQSFVRGVFFLFHFIVPLGLNIMNNKSAALSKCVCLRAQRHNTQNMKFINWNGIFVCKIQFHCSLVVRAFNYCMWHISILLTFLRYVRRMRAMETIQMDFIQTKKKRMRTRNMLRLSNWIWANRGRNI